MDRDTGRVIGAGEAPAPQLDLVVFDLAGTTVEDRGEVPGAFAAALEEFGIAISAEQVASVRGASKREAIARMLPDAPGRPDRGDRVYAAFRAHLARRYGAAATPVRGAIDTFGWLRARGVRIAFTTGFDREVTTLLLDGLGWARGVADGVVCADDVREGRPAPYMIFEAMETVGVRSVHAVACVGDTVLDLQAAYNAGVRWNIAVLSGAHARDRLEGEPHTHVIASVADLPSIWQSVSRSTE